MPFPWRARSYRLIFSARLHDLLGDRRVSLSRDHVVVSEPARLPVPHA